jgi:hypothetical protein
MPQREQTEEPPLQLAVLRRALFRAKPEDEVQTIDRTGAAVTRPGDLWLVGPHRILCADALKMASYATLMGEELQCLGIPLRGS